MGSKRQRPTAEDGSVTLTVRVPKGIHDRLLQLQMKERLAKGGRVFIQGLVGDALEQYLKRRGA